MAYDIEDTAEFTAGNHDNVHRLHVVTQKRRYNLIVDILGHPRGLPSLSELDYMNPPVERTTIQDHLQRLIEVDVVETVVIPVGERSRDLPHVFYGLTESGRQLLDSHGLLDEAEAWQDLYARVEKPEKIRTYEDAPRPERTEI
ncbi:transcriptional regulator [Haladaptatus sp. CMAA 1911]|uniref:transcriptional regulator n=1 Tax=unclassified Haladaptatus TaxID=2622732 RepID=UPI003755034D